MADVDSTKWLKEVFEFTVRPDEDGQRLDRILANRLKGYSRQTILGLIDLHNGEPGVRPLKPGRRYRSNESFHIKLVREIHRPPSQPGSLVIVYEDDDLLVVDKDSATPIHGAGPHVDTLVDLLRRYGYSGSWPVHRLDRETSGLVLIARSKECARRFQQSWSSAAGYEDSASVGSEESVSALTEQVAAAGRAIRKTYLALVHGVPVPPSGEIDAPIGPCPGLQVRVKQGVVPVELGGRPSRTWYRMLAAFEKHAFVMIRPSTGRMHQIRVHMLHIGHPIVGDKLYGVEEQVYLRFIEDRLSDDDRRRLLAPAHMLHAGRLELVHPMTGRPLLLHSPLPGSWEPILEQVSGMPAAMLRELADGAEE